MLLIFLECLTDGYSLLEKLPDISNWNISNAIYMNQLFFECSSLKSLPDISKWNKAIF